MLHKEFWGLVFLAFVVWIFVASTGNDRIERFCKPVGWGGSVVVSLASLAMPDQAGPTQKWFDKFEYGCRYMTWRVFYQDDYNKYIEAKKIADAKAAEQQKAAAAAPASAPASAPATEPAKEASK